MHHTKKKRIISSVTNDLVTDQRLHKVSSSLVSAGYQVTLIGRKLKNSKPIHRSYPVHRIHLLFNTKFLFYAEYNIRLFFHLLFARVDVYLSNDTDTLLANYLASKIRNKPLVFDAHELFPELPEVVDRPFVKRFWTGIENWIFPKLKNAYTVCQPIADIYREKYGITMQVVRNIPQAISHKSKKEKPIDHEGKHILLYQGAVNLGRGLEWIIDTMPLLDDCIFYIVGDGNIMPELKGRVKLFQLEDRVKFIGRIPMEHLSEYTACADIGISLLENRGLNYYFSLPNRIFDFIRENVPILATDFPEIRKIIEKYDVGILVNSYEPQQLAATIRKMIATKKNQEGFLRANVELTWEKESEILLSVVEKATK